MKDYKTTETTLDKTQFFKVIVASTDSKAKRPLIELTFYSLDMALKKKHEYEEHFNNVVVNVIRIEQITKLVKETK